MKKIVALVDFSDVTTQVLKQAQTLARAFDSQVIVAHVMHRQPVVMDLGIASPTIMETPTADAALAEYAKLMKVRDSLATEGVNVAAEQWLDVSVEKLLEEIRRLHADLIIVGSHHHSAIFNFFIGGFGQEVLKQAPCPVLVVPLQGA
jgi:nucleotide-binding universal stress UspA family protein